MARKCEEFSHVLGGIYLFASAYWAPWLACWALAARQSPPPHLFNLVIFLLLLSNIGEDAFEAYYYLSNRPHSCGM